MTNHTVNMLLWGIAGLVVFHTLSSFFTYFQNKRKARQLGCQDAPRVPDPYWDVFGIFRLRNVFAAAKKMRFPEYTIYRHNVVREYVGYEALTYYLHIFGKKTYFTMDPKNLQAVLATQFKDFNLPPNRKSVFGPLLGQGIFTSDGQVWEHSRALLRPSFSREQVSHLDLEERHNANLHRAIPTPGPDGWTAPVDMCALFFRLTLDSSTEFLFGESVDSQLDALPNAKPSSPEDQWKRQYNFGENFDNAQKFITKRGRMGQGWWLLQSKEFNKNCDNCHKFIDHYVRRALQQDTKPRDTESKHSYVFLDELAQQTRDPTELRSQLIHILLAGRDTTAGLLSWLVLLLARHPDVYAKLRQSILDDFGTDSSNITFSKLKSNAYLQACLNETLRLYPIVPFNSRHAVNDTTLPRGGGPRGESPIFIPKGTDVAYSVYILHRSKTVWGEDADDFKPERFIKRKQGFEFLPFNGGPRVCLGQNFALTSAGYCAVKLCQRFEAVTGVQGEETREEVPRQKTDITSRPHRGTVVQWKVAA